MYEQLTTDFDDARRAIEESHRYLRQNMTLWVQWFTFFITINYLGLGWFAEEFVKNATIADRKPLTYVSLLLISQCILGIWVSLLLRRWFLTSNRELSSKYERLPAPVYQAPSSTEFYAAAIALGCCAMLGLIVAWTWLAIRP